MTPPQTLVLPEDGDWKVRVVPNLYPALERQEVVVHSRRHIRSLAEARGRRAAARRGGVATARGGRARQRVPADQRRARSRREPCRTPTRSSSGCRSRRLERARPRGEVLLERDGVGRELPLGEPRALRDGDRTRRARRRSRSTSPLLGPALETPGRARPPATAARGAGAAQRLARARRGRLAARALPAADHPGRARARRRRSSSTRCRPKRRRRGCAQA